MFCLSFGTLKPGWSSWNMEAIEKNASIQWVLCKWSFVSIVFYISIIPHLNWIFSWKSSANSPKLVSQFEKIDVELWELKLETYVLSLDSQLLILSRIQDWLKAEAVSLPVHLRGTVGQLVNTLFYKFLVLTHFLYLITHMTNSHLVNVREAVLLLHIRRKQRTVHHQLPVPLLSASKLYWVLHHLQSWQDL